MFYCVQCGNGVGDQDVFCAKCGTRQGVAGAAAAAEKPDFWSSLTPRQTAMLCYIPWVGWIAAIAVLATERFRENNRLRFHAFQGLYIFVAWLMIEWVIQPFVGYRGYWVGRPFPTADLIPKLMQLVVLGAWIVMLIKVNHDEDYRLPLVGELADRSVSEQRS